MARRPEATRARRPEAARRSTSSRPPARSRADRETARRIFDHLDRQHPHADTELVFHTPFELLVATVLSAQCTDARVNQVTPGLFAEYPDARAFATIAPETLEPVLQPTGFFRMKSRAVVGLSQVLVDEYGGHVPASMAALVALPGVGRKTANVVLGHAFHVPAFPVDRHVLRVANRLGLVQSDDPEVVEAALSARLQPERWTRASDALILHGRRVCRPKPLCDRCQVRQDCAYFRRLGASASSAARARLRRP
jgi:endonuclease III